MKIKLSKKNWEAMGRKAGWMKCALGEPNGIESLKSLIREMEIDLETKKKELKRLIQEEQKEYSRNGQIDVVGRPGKWQFI